MQTGYDVLWHQSERVPVAVKASGASVLYDFEPVLVGQYTNSLGTGPDRSTLEDF